MNRSRAVERFWFAVPVLLFFAASATVAAAAISGLSVGLVRNDQRGIAERGRPDLHPVALATIRDPVGDTARGDTTGVSGSHSYGAGLTGDSGASEFRAADLAAQITIIKDADAADGTDFGFEGDSGLGSFTLDDADPDDNDGIGDTITFADLQPGTYEIREFVPLGWVLSDVTCTTNDAEDTTVFDADTSALAVDLDPGEDIVCTFLNLGQPMLSIDKARPYGDVRATWTFWYRICVRNTGTSPALDLVVEDQLPSEVAPWSVKPSHGGEYHPDTHTVTWYRPILGVGQQACLWIEAKTFSTMAGQTMLNGACVEAANAEEPVCDTDEAYIYPQPPPPPPTPTPTPQCPDTYEPNGDFDQAWVLVPGTYQSYICCQSPQDSDYFGFAADAGDQIEVWLSSLPANYELCLFDPDRAEVECSAQSSTADEHIQHTAQQSGQYYVSVYGFGATACDSADPYTLRIEVTEPTPVPTATPTTGGIVACVWEDLNGNGERDTGEPGLQGVLLVVTEDADDSRIIGTCSTGASGCCTFADLDPGTYTVTAGGVSGFLFTTPPTRAVDVSAGVVSEVAFGARQWFTIVLPVVFKNWQ